ncbi:MAG: helix-turn-helix domain-containing protein [bacterium]
MQSLSALLKNRREDLNYSLETVSDQTKIRIEYLDALEEGRYEEFPSEVYLKGFLKTYAKFLNLDNSLVQALYRREQSVRQKKKPIESISKQFREPRVIITRKRLAIILIALILVAVGIFLLTQFTKLTKSPDLSLTEPVIANQNDKEVVFSTSSETLNIVGKAEVGSTVTINGQKVILNQLNEFRIDSYKIDKEKMVMVVRSENQFGKASEIILNIFKKASDTTATVPLASQGIRNIWVRLEALEDVNIKLTVDGNVVVNRNVTKGTIFDEGARPDLSLQALNKVELTIANGMKVNLQLNGIRYIPNDGITSWELINGKIEQH